VDDRLRHPVRDFGQHIDVSEVMIQVAIIGRLRRVGH